MSETDDSSFANRKSRLEHVRADVRASEWRSVGSITIRAPELEHPIVLDMAGYHVVFQEARHKGDLRSALITLSRHYRKPDWWWVPVLCFAFFVLGVGLRRLLFSLF